MNQSLELDPLDLRVHLVLLVPQAPQDQRVPGEILEVLELLEILVMPVKLVLMVTKAEVELL
ncbi:hypothetical protein, partial [Salmonella sp. s54925]|uniref:hypothetical protein n=1 Tax=Salmonella sp. s54925 TaxID=3159674 RepID=UPI003980BA49